METSTSHLLHAALETRRSINTFDAERPVPKPVIEEALRLAVLAPNHRRSEPWRFYVAGPEMHARIVELNAGIIREKRGDEAANNAQARWATIPGFLVATCVPHEEVLKAKEDYAACACAVQNLMLALWAEGIGTKWTTGPVTRDERLLELIGAEAQNEYVVALLHYGYPAEVPDTQRPRAEPVTTWLR